MRKFIMLATAGALLFSAGLARAQKAVARRARIVPADQSGTPSPQPIASVSSPPANPPTIQFIANNPGSSVAANSSAAIKGSVTGGFLGTWTLSVYANSSIFTGCSTVVLNHQLTNSWEYKANTCSLIITSTVNAP